MTLAASLTSARFSSLVHATLIREATLAAHDYSAAAAVTPDDGEARYYANLARFERTEAARSLPKQHHIIWC